MGQKSIILAIGLIIFTIILAVVFVFVRISRGQNSNQKSEETVTQEEPRDVVSVEDIVTDPMVYNNYSLEVDSEVSGWATNKSFYFSATIGGGFAGGAKRSLIVIAKEPFDLPQDPNDDKLGLGEISKVTVKGKIQVLDEAQLESALGVDFDDPNNVLYDDNLEDWTIGPVLFADEIIIDKIIK